MEPIHSDALANDKCTTCSSPLFRPRPDKRLKQDFKFCTNGHIWLYDNQENSSVNSDNHTDEANVTTEFLNP